MVRPNPFRAPDPTEVPLSSAPLVRVIAQLRFAPIASLGQLGFIAPFQEAIRPSYPILRPQQAASLVVAEGGAPALVQSTSWRFGDKTGKWFVSLAPDFVALETTSYTSRADFFVRLGAVLEAFTNVTEPGLVGYDRFGVRYVNRVQKPQFDDLSRLVHPEVLGIAGPLADDLGFSICESSFNVEDASLRARWGVLPAGATTDPTTIEPLSESSWILDLDMFVERQAEFDGASVVSRGRLFAEAVYKLFRWCVTDEFLRAYGGHQ